MSPKCPFSRRPPFLAVLCLVLGMVMAFGAEVIPPAPGQYFNDYAKVVSPTAAGQMNAQLEQFERDSSSQVLVAVFPKMESDSSIEDYTVRVAEAWKVGQKEKNNGAVLFVFIQDRSMFLQVGYGLEGALPDALAKQIIENEIKPNFRNGDYESGLRAGVTAILQAVKGEYNGTGRTAAEGSRGSGPGVGGIILTLLVLAVFLRMVSGLNRGRVYHRRGYRTWGGGWSGGSWGGGGGWGGGGFSGGGGSFGGGGAGGRW